VGEVVYSIMYYAVEAITRAIIGLALKIADLMSGRSKLVSERRREERPQPQWGLYRTSTPTGEAELIWVGRATGLRVPFLPASTLKPLEAPPPTPQRLYFSFSEAASKDFFKEIEWLAERAKGGEASAG